MSARENVATIASNDSNFEFQLTSFYDDRKGLPSTNFSVKTNPIWIIYKIKIN